MINDRTNLLRYYFTYNQIVTIEKVVNLYLDEWYCEMLPDK